MAHAQPRARGLRMSHSSVTRVRCVLFQITITASCLFYCMKGEFEQIYSRAPVTRGSNSEGKRKRFLFTARVVGIDGIQFAMSVIACVTTGPRIF